MKQFVWALFGVCAIIFTLSSTACNKDKCKADDCVCNENCPDTIRFQLSANAASASERANSAEIIAKVIFRNTSTADTAVQFKWIVVSDSLPTGWDRAVCDNAQCWAPSVNTKNMTTMPNDTFEFKLNFYPNNIVGTGTSTVRIFVPGDSAATVQTVVFTGEATN